MRRRFLDRMIRARIGIRVLAEHHVAMHEDVEKGQRPNYFGIINHRLSPAAMIAHVQERAAMLSEANYGMPVDVTLHGQTDATFAYLPVHLDYMLFELFKNAHRATLEFARKSASSVVPLMGTLGGFVLTGCGADRRSRAMQTLRSRYRSR